MIILTHYVEAEIPLSKCCAVSSNDRTTNLPSYCMQHSSLALSTINLTAAHNS